MRWMIFLLLASSGIADHGAAQPANRQRARDLGIEIGLLPPGPLNAITDVADVRVGHATLIEGDDVRTGVTAIVPHGGNVFQSKVAAAFVVGNGFGKFVGSTQLEELGRLETPIVLTNTLSTFAAADAVVHYTLGREGNERVRSVNAVVGECNDGYLNDIRARVVTRDHVLRAISDAKPGPVLEGCIGAGTGTRCPIADELGVPRDQLRGTLQNDILKEFIAQKEWISPVEPSMRIISDMLVFCTEQMPRWNTISISGYHIREAGATAVEELAFTLADGIGYVELGIEAGLKVDDFAPRLSFFFDIHNDFFEEIAKFRAARRLWARIMRERFGAENPRSWLLRTHAQTAGVSLTAQQPYNNIIRTTVQALAGVLGGTQSLHTNSFDETYALPTEDSVEIALRTQQVLANESGVANVVDPLAGSYFIESLTDQMERAAMKLIEQIDSIGGIVPAIENGFPQKEIANSAFRYQREVEANERIIVGVNQHRTADTASIPTLRIDDAVEKDQVLRIQALRKKRAPEAAREALDQVRGACQGKDNLMPPIIAAAKADITLGEICDVFREEFGVYRDPAFW